MGGPAAEAALTDVARLDAGGRMEGIDGHGDLAARLDQLATAERDVVDACTVTPR